MQLPWPGPNDPCETGAAAPTPYQISLTKCTGAAPGAKCTGAPGAKCAGAPSAKCTGAPGAKCTGAQGAQVLGWTKCNVKREKKSLCAKMLWCTQLPGAKVLRELCTVGQRCTQS